MRIPSNPNKFDVLRATNPAQNSTIKAALALISAAPRLGLVVNNVVAIGENASGGAPEATLKEMILEGQSQTSPLFLHPEVTPLDGSLPMSREVLGLAVESMRSHLANIPPDPFTPIAVLAPGMTIERVVAACVMANPEVLEHLREVVAAHLQTIVDAEG